MRGIRLKAAVFFSELKRRNVWRACAFYAAAVWALAQGLAQLLPLFGDYNWIARWFVIACIIGFPFWIAFAWFYEFTPNGLKRESEITEGDSIAHHTGRKLNFWIFGIMAVAIVLLVTNTFVRHRDATSTAEVADNKALAATLAKVPDKSVAVLPFVNMGGNPNNDYFSDGITEEILNALAQIPGLKVAARTSAFQFNSKDADLRKVGRILGVATLLEGSVQRDGNQVRITVRLVDTRSGYQMWSENYDRKLTHIFAIEDEISNAIAGKLRVQLTGGGGQSLVAQLPIDPQAHDFYLRGLTLLAVRGAGLRDAAAAFHGAVQIAPNYALAWGALAVTEALYPDYELGSMQAAHTHALFAAQRALKLDPDIALAYVAQGIVYKSRRQWPGADEAFRRALSLAPGDVEAVDQYAQLLLTAGQFEAALTEIERAQRLDPFSGVVGAVRAYILLILHDYEAASAQIENTLEAHPEFLIARGNAMAIEIALHHYSEAGNQARVYAELIGVSPEASALLGRGIADPTSRARALQCLEASPACAPLSRNPMNYAKFLAALGERDGALRALERYAVQRISTHPEGLWWPVFDSVRDDPRFKSVMKKMGLPYTPKHLPAT